ncbi:uncharacterized protein LOC62_01G000013 [Vanrija pseudolonga]|uniref:Uncharacterized protein n=1 Tax=Vanrija pseudolonga TaxID=143232 RepID=A0AAF0Y1X1_9TREE|nr:hypothetical protein LOC62_01G000013 [Vanrija pseudolonga]
MDLAATTITVSIGSTPAASHTGHHAGPSKKAQMAAGLIVACVLIIVFTLASIAGGVYLYLKWRREKRAEGQRARCERGQGPQLPLPSLQRSRSDKPGVKDGTGDYPLATLDCEGKSGFLLMADHDQRDRSASSSSGSSQGKQPLWSRSPLDGAELSEPRERLPPYSPN